MSQDENKIVYTLSDGSISQIAKLIQVAILTGTDIVDNLRTLRVISNGATLDPDPSYTESFENNLEALLEKAENLAAQAEEEVSADGVDLDEDDW